MNPIMFRPKGISNRDDTKLRYGPVKVLEIVWDSRCSSVVKHNTMRQKYF